jgi:hypothetical protein
LVKKFTVNKHNKHAGSGGHGVKHGLGDERLSCIMMPVPTRHAALLCTGKHADKHTYSRAQTTN